MKTAETKVVENVSETRALAADALPEDAEQEVAIVLLTRLKHKGRDRAEGDSLRMPRVQADHMVANGFARFSSPSDEK